MEDRIGKIWYNTGIRIPKELHERVKKLAVDDYRTFNSMLILLLEEALRKHKQDRGKESYK